MIDPKIHWTYPYRILFTTSRADEHGQYTIQLLDFSRTKDGREVRIPDNHKRFGWALRCSHPVTPSPSAPLGGSREDPNDPTVGSEDSYQLALDRAGRVRQAIVLPMRAREDAVLESLKCKGCEAPMPDLLFEPCTICGQPVCDVCGEKNNGVCGKDVVLEDGAEFPLELADRAIERAPEDRARDEREIDRRADDHRDPMGGSARTFADEVAAIEEAAALLPPREESEPSR